MKGILTVLAFCLVAMSFGIIFVGAYLDKGQEYVNLFVLYFVMGALAFWGWLALENKEKKSSKKSWKSNF
jgi:hypothetical protein